MNLKNIPRIDTTYPLENKWIRIRKDRYQLPEGVAEYYTQEGHSWIMVCGITPQKEIIFVRQFRVSIQKDHLELPAGRMDKENENPVDTARREFEEETGYSLTEIHSLGIVNTFSGRMAIQGNLFAARTTLTRTEQSLDATEDIEIVKIPVKKVLEMIHQNEIPCLPSLSAILLTKERFPEWFKP